MYVDSISWSPFVTDMDQVVAADLRAALEDLFIEKRVDVTWHGHHHSYQRTCSLAHGVCVRQGEEAPVHLVIGHGGAALCPNIRLFTPRLFEKVVLRHGYLRVDVNVTHMRHQVLATDTGVVMDDFTLVKK